jgi:K(+)-stimulated pyrophosphate-energized sodium pump
VIKFTTLFGVLAVGLALELHEKGLDKAKWVVAGISILISMAFAWRSFYGMRIESKK